MDILSAVILGLVQGLTEFLPVSSSGHLVLSQYLLGYEGSNLAFDLLVHVGTLLAVVIYFRKDIYRIASSAITGVDGGEGRREAMLIATGTVPTVIIGFTFADQFEALFLQPKIVALMLWITALLLLASDRIRIRDSVSARITVWRSLLVGTAQGLAIIPGISRSGSTIVTAIFTGINPERAARFSFLLSIPAILGATIFKLPEIAGINSTEIPAYLFGTLTAFVSGYLAIGLLLKMVVKRSLWKFSVYLFVVGLAGLLLT